MRDLPDGGESVAVALYCTGAPFQAQDGVVIGVYQHHAGKLTLNTLQVTRMLGHPAADRLLLNMIAYAQTTAAPLAPLPDNYEVRFP